MILEETLYINQSEQLTANVDQTVEIDLHIVQEQQETLNIDQSREYGIEL